MPKPENYQDTFGGGLAGCQLRKKQDQTRVNTRQRFAKSGGHISWPSSCFFAPHDCLSFSIQLFDTKQSLDRNPIGFCQPKDFLTSRHFASSFPSRQGGSRNAAQSGRFVLSQFSFPSEIMQPGSVGISPRFWFSSHAAARIICEDRSFSILSRFRQCWKLEVDKKCQKPQSSCCSDGLHSWANAHPCLLLGFRKTQTSCVGVVSFSVY